MKTKDKVTDKEQQLIRRYLLWCYKTTREEWERTERKFTQLSVDRRVLKEIEKRARVKQQCPYQQHIDEFRQYITTKESQAQREKFVGGRAPKLESRFWYLQERLGALEKTIKQCLGAKALKDIEQVYDEEMARRILAAREH